MPHTLYLDTEFTDPRHPELLSLALVSSDGHEHYVELDPDDPAGAAILARASDFVRHDGVLAQWGRVPAAAASLEQMGLRTARWVVEQVQRFGQPAAIAHDHDVDYRLFEALLGTTGHWESVRDKVVPLDVRELSSRFDAALAADDAYTWMARRGIERHDALADAQALRVGCIGASTGRRVRL